MGSYYIITGGGEFLNAESEMLNKFEMRNNKISTKLKICSDF
jgi:hypothetical protein